MSACLQRTGSLLSSLRMLMLMKVYSRLYFQNISSPFDLAQLFDQEKKTGKLCKCLHSVDSTTCSMHELLICQGFHLRIQEEIKSQMGCIVINRATHSIYIGHILLMSNCFFLLLLFFLFLLFFFFFYSSFSISFSFPSPFS